MTKLFRISLLLLALTGAVATTHFSVASREQASARTVTPKMTAFPIPVCPPDDPNGCGIMGN